MTPKRQPSQKPLKLVEVPTTLYHGSTYAQDELKPGYNRFGFVRVYGRDTPDAYVSTETNHYLYATSQRETAVDYAVFRTLEDSPLQLRGFVRGGAQVILSFDSLDVNAQALQDLCAWLYILRPREGDCWIRNADAHPSLGEGHYRTRRTIVPEDMLRIDMAAWLRRNQVIISAPVQTKVA